MAQATTYELRVRTVLRARCSRDEVLKEYDSWVRP